MLAQAHLARRIAYTFRVARKTEKPLPGRLRIVAGKWRSRRLRVADVPGLRPTSERIRETLFNWLMPRLAGARCLDLYAGTGALGIEALSRGAGSAVFVEKSARAVRVLEDNLAMLGAEDAVVLRTDADRFLADPQSGPFDLVFLDPPFAADCIAAVCRGLAEGGLLAPGALVYVEDDRAREPAGLPAGWETTRSGTAGNVRYALLTTGA